VVDQGEKREGRDGQNRMRCSQETRRGNSFRWGELCQKGNPLGF